MASKSRKVGDESPELRALQKLDDACVQLQKDGKYLEALESMEKGLVLRQHFYGPDSEEVRNACKTVGELCNLLSMNYLQQEDYPMVLELLKKAEILTEKDLRGRAATYNNFACYYRRKGKLHSALQYLQKALKIEANLTNVQNPADTHINACAVLSQLGRHQQALEHAQNALLLLQEELLSPQSQFPSTSANTAAAMSRNDAPGDDDDNDGEDHENEESDRERMMMNEDSNNNNDPTTYSTNSNNNNDNNNTHNNGNVKKNTNITNQPPQADRIAVLAIAYHNTGVEHEFLKRYDQSILNYRKGVEIAERYIGIQHPICTTLKNSLTAAKKSLVLMQAKEANKLMKKGIMNNTTTTSASTDTLNRTSSHVHTATNSSNSSASILPEIKRTTNTSNHSSHNHRSPTTGNMNSSNNTSTSNDSHAKTVVALKALHKSPYADFNRTT